MQARQKILVIEDEPSFREVVVAALEGEGFTVLEAANGGEGIELARSHQPDLILSDIMMEGVNGFEAVVSIRRDERTHGIPIILMTAKADKESMRYGIELGADDYLQKPFTISELLSAIHARLNRTVRGRGKKSGSEELPVSLRVPASLESSLSAILSFSEVLSRDYEPLKHEEMVEMGRAIHKAARKLERLVEHLAVATRVELASMDPGQVSQLRSIQTPTTVSMIEATSKSVAGKDGRSDDLKLHLTEAPVCMASPYLEILVREAVKNAIQYSRQGQSILVGTSQARGTFELSVMGGGQEMTGAEFQGLDTALSFEGQSGPLTSVGGLHLAKRLAEIHGGSMAIQQTEGGGVKILFTLPAPR